jgi:hypothetical protein
VNNEALGTGWQLIGRVCMTLSDAKYELTLMQFEIEQRAAQGKQRHGTDSDEAEQPSRGSARLRCCRLAQ